jgi:hypothetical protein
MIQPLGDKQCEVSEKDKDDSHMKKIAAQFNFLIGKKLSGFSLNGFVAQNKTCNQSKEKHRQCNMRKISEQ